MRPLLLLVALASAGCGTALRSTYFDATKVIRVDPRSYGTAHAVVLLREDQFAQLYTAAGDFASERQTHTLVQVLTEGGLAAASEVRIPVSGKTKLVNLLARRIAPDGTTEEVDAARMLTTEARGGPKKLDLQFRLFQFPNAKVGDLLEVVYTIRASGLTFLDRVRVAGPL